MSLMLSRKEMLELFEQGKSAIDISIIKWERGLNLAKCLNLSDEDDQERLFSALAYTENCALCEEHFNRNYNTCDGCPIAEYTGKSRCAGTPYSEFRSAMTDSNISNIIKAIEREIEFLKMIKCRMRSKIQSGE